MFETAENESNSAKGKPVWEMAEDRVRHIPEEVMNGIPADGAAQHEHYLHGPPKRD